MDHFFVLRRRRPPRSTRTDTLFPYTTLFRSRPHRFVGNLWPEFGLVRVQWEGPWTAPGVPMAARYRQTHWIGTMLRADRQRGIWDVNCLANGGGWVSLSDWESVLVPWLLQECHPKANGG